MIDYALHYAKLGWPVFPLNGKVPAISREKGGRGCLDATTNPDQIETWWKQYPDANIGVATGKTSGLLVVDVDPRKTDTWLDSLHSLSLPPTLTIKTWSGGWHLYFRYFGSDITIGAELLPGIDWRCNGGYVVGAGSLVQGAAYEISKSLPIVDAPRALLEMLLKRKRMSRPVADEAGHMVIPAGTRNETLFALACLLRRFGLEYNSIYEALRAANLDHCEPPTDEEELRQITGSAMRYAPKASA